MGVRSTLDSVVKGRSVPFVVAGAVVSLALAAPAAGVTLAAACHRSPPTHVVAPSGGSGLATSIPYTLIYRVPGTGTLTPLSTEGLVNFAALAVARHKTLITVTSDSDRSRPCDTSSLSAAVLDELRASLRDLRSGIRVVTIEPGPSSSVTVTS